jgi:hypothetical protein
MLNCEEVKLYLHDYVDELLDKKILAELETHLDSCETCSERYNKLASIINKIKDLPGVMDLPFNIREKFSDELFKRDDEQKAAEGFNAKESSKKMLRDHARLEKELKKARKENKTVLINIDSYKKILNRIFKKEGLNIKKNLLTILPLVIIVVGYYLYDYSKINSPWEVEWKYGNYSINDVDNANLELDKGEWLTTKDSSQVTLYVPQTGRIELNSNSRVILLNPKNGDNKIILRKGVIKIITTTQIPYLEVELKHCSIKDIGGVFTVSRNEDGNAKVFVNFGMVEILYKDISYLLDEGYNCELIEGKQPGTPYRFDAADSLKNFVREFDLEKNEELIDKIISEAVSSDALTLLALIPKVTPIKRQILFQKVSNFFPPPKDVTRMGIVTLNSDMLDSWWNEIEWQI